MTEEARGEWLAVAWETLKHLPPDLLSRGCQKARATCDHPAKIVPAILSETEDQMKWRSETVETAPMIAGPARPRSATALMDARGKPMTQAEAETLNAHLEWLGSPARYRADGSKYQAQAA